jgi:orotate phosphoribosyltransferase
MTTAALRPADVVSRDDPRWTRLRDLISEHSLKLGDFVLSSGRQSKYIFQLRQATMHPEGATLMGDIIVDYMRAEGLFCVGGLAVGAVPMVSAVAVMSHVKGFPVEAFFVRKEAKSHGALERIDGHVAANGEALMIDDVATSGGSIIKAMEGLHEEHPGCRVTRALVVIDREEGAAEALAARGIALASIFKKSDFAIGV